MDIKKLLENRFKEGIHSKIREEELITFVREYLLINELKNQYQEGNSNRKVIAEMIVEKVNDMEALLSVFECDLSKDRETFNHPMYLSDFKKAFSLLLKQANSSEKKYASKTFYTNRRMGHDNRESGMPNSEIWVIGEKEVLDVLDNTKVYYGAAFGELVDGVIERNHSLVMITNDYQESRVLPTCSEIDINKRKFRIQDFPNDLCCYTYDDKLGFAVDKLSRYIEVYGGDIRNLSMEMILDRMNNLDYSEEKVHFKAK